MHRDPDAGMQLTGEAGFRVLVESIPGAVYRREAAPPWRFVYVSEAIASIAGYAAKDLVPPGSKADSVAAADRRASAGTEDPGALLRDVVAEMRDDVADARDGIADARDEAAGEHDAIADARDTI
jgi:hypothetical protein